MNDINPIGGLATSATLREYAKFAPTNRDPQNGTTGPSDTIEISELAAFLSRLAELPDDRARKIVDIRRSIVNGTYETPEKLDYAVGKLLEEIDTAS